jgi:hypothetical protein
MRKNKEEITTDNVLGKRRESSRLMKVKTPEESPIKGATLPRSSSAASTSNGKKSGFIPDYTNYVLSYSCPETERPGTGIVGTYDHEQKRYEVQFTFTDKEEPYTQVDWCPRKFVESNMVDPDVARKWLEEVQKQQEMDTPRTKA